MNSQKTYTLKNIITGEIYGTVTTHTLAGAQEYFDAVVPYASANAMLFEVAANPKEYTQDELIELTYERTSSMSRGTGKAVHFYNWSHEQKRYIPTFAVYPDGSTKLFKHGAELVAAKIS